MLEMQLMFAFSLPENKNSENYRRHCYKYLMLKGKGLEIFRKRFRNLTDLD